MIVTIYNKTTFKFMYSGDDGNGKAQGLIVAGHVSTPGAYGEKTMWDDVNSVVIPDADKIQEEASHEQAKADYTALRAANLAFLVPTIGTIRALPEVNEAIDKIIEILDTP